MTKMMGGVYLLLLCCTLGSATADEIETLYMRANEHYQKSDYNSAITEYQKILNLGYESWEVYYNLGNCYYKNSDIAHAILNYERARKLEPKNEDINFNLELANLSVVDRIPQLPQFLLYAWISALASLISLQGLGIFAAGFYVLFSVTLILRMLLRSGRFARMANATTVLVAAGLVVFSGLFLIRVYENESIIEAIVVANKVDVASAPAGAGTELFTLHEGVKLQIQDRSGSWLKIRLADGKLGWLLDDAIERI